MEYEEYAGFHYGTLKSEIEVRNEWEVPLIEVEVKGHMKLRRLLESESTTIVSFLIVPPSLDVLEGRLREARSTELSEEQISRRLERAREEIAFAKEFDTFGHVITNNDGRAEDAARVMRGLIRFSMVV